MGRERLSFDFAFDFAHVGIFPIDRLGGSIPAAHLGAA